MSLINSQRKQTFINLISGILAMLINMGINFILSPYIVRVLGEEANGFTQLANNFITYASLITIAFNSMAGRFISINYHQGNYKKVKEYYSSVAVSNIVIAGILIPIAIYIVQNLEKIISIENVNMYDVKILFACVFLNFFVNIIISIYNISTFVTNSLHYQNILNVIRYILNGILLLACFSILPAKVYYVSLIALLLSIMVMIAIRKIHFKLMPEYNLSINNFRLIAVKEMVAAGIWNTVNQCGHMLMTGLDLLVCNLFISPKAMGVLSVAKIVPNSISSLATLINSNFSPELTINYAKGDKSELLKQLRSNMKISSVIISIPIITFCTFGIPFYSLWMPTMDAKQLTILSFLTCMVFIPWAGPQTLYNVFTATNRLKVNSIAFLVSGFVNIGLVFICLQYTTWGIYAVAGVSSVITTFRNLLIIVPYTAKLLDLPWYVFYKDVLISLFCCVLSFCVSVFIQYILSPSSWSVLLCAIMVSCLIALILDVLFILDKKERTLFFDKLRRK